MSSQADAILAIPQQPQNQASLREQLFLLLAAANRLGLYDAADYLLSHRNSGDWT